MRAIWAFLALCLAACASAPPDANETMALQSAIKPSSPQAAQAAVKKYFDKRLIDSESARWDFDRPPVQGATGMLRGRMVGWMMCGQLNSKNRMGGYTGFDQFFVYFSPTVPDTVQVGLIGDEDAMRILVRDHCGDAYRGQG